jgi:hypothetical protein
MASYLDWSQYIANLVAITATLIALMISADAFFKKPKVLAKLSPKLSAKKTPVCITSYTTSHILEALEEHIKKTYSLSLMFQLKNSEG